jgi:hypothetical protein
MVEKQGGTKLKWGTYPSYPSYMRIRNNVNISLTPKQLDHVRILLCVYGQQLLNQVASVDDPCWWHHMCFGFWCASFVLLYVVKFLRIVKVLHNFDNGGKTTLISCDAARCKGGESLCWNNIDITWRLSLHRLHCYKQLNLKRTKKKMQNNIKIINCTIALKCNTSFPN